MKGYAYKLIITSIFSFVFAKDILSFDKVVQLTLQHSQKVLTAYLSAKNQRLSIADKNTYFWPDVVVSYKNEDASNLEVFDPLVTASLSLPTGTNVSATYKFTDIAKGIDEKDSYKISVSQPLLKDFFLNQHLLDVGINKVELKVIEAQMRQQINQAVVEVLKKYRRLILSHKKLNLLQSKQESLLNQKKERLIGVEEGINTQMEVQETELELQKNALELNSLENRIYDETKQLEIILEIKLQDYDLVKNIDIFDFEPKELLEYENLAKNQNATYLSAYKGLYMAKKNIKSASNANLPSVNVKFDMDKDKYSLGFDASYNFSQLVKSSVKKQALNTKQISEIDFIEMVQENELYIKTTVAEIKKQKIELDILEKKVSLSHKLMQYKMVSYENEKISLHEYLKAQNDYYNQSLILLEAKVNFNNLIDDFSVFLGTTNLEWKFTYDT